MKHNAQEINFAERSAQNLHWGRRRPPLMQLPHILSCGILFFFFWPDRATHHQKRRGDRKRNILLGWPYRGIVSCNVSWNWTSGVFTLPANSVCLSMPQTDRHRSMCFLTNKYSQAAENDAESKQDRIEYCRKNGGYLKILI